MDARQIIRLVRDGKEPTQAQLNWFARGLGTGEVSDAQAGAFAMATCLKGLSEEARVALTMAMRDSGSVLKWNLDGPAIDKHSTGGLGDCVSLLLAPMLAAVGANVPMISGRGLGHTGGTIDKLEAIPGVNAAVSEARFRQMIGDIGCAIVSATSDIAPADGRLYAVRDVTDTVNSIDLITASILSKKLSAGLGALIFDVKTGTGAFMTTPEHARVLANALVKTADGAGCRATALITDMNQPLAPAVGNAVELAVVMEALTDPKPSRLIELTLALGAELMVLAGLDTAPEVAAVKLREALQSGAAAEAFEAMVAALGGPKDLATSWKGHIAEANVIRDVEAPEDGVVSGMDGTAIGLAVVALGGGRQRDGDRIDPSVGFSEVLPLGTEVKRGTPLARLHAASGTAADAAERAFLNAVTLSDAGSAPALILDKVVG